MTRLIGTTEDPPGSNHTSVGAFYGVQGAWCAMAVTMAFVKAGSTGFARGSRWSFTGPKTFRTIGGNVDDTCKQLDQSMSAAPRIDFVRASK